MVVVVCLHSAIGKFSFSLKYVCFIVWFSEHGTVFLLDIMPLISTRIKQTHINVSKGYPCFLTYMQHGGA